MIAVALASLFVGDSTVQGAAQAFNRSVPAPCPIVARKGAGSSEVARWALPSCRPVTAFIPAPIQE